MPLELLYLIRISEKGWYFPWIPRKFPKFLDFIKKLFLYLNNEILQKTIARDYLIILKALEKIYLQYMMQNKEAFNEIYK